MKKILIGATSLIFLISPLFVFAQATSGEGAVRPGTSGSGAIRPAESNRICTGNECTLQSPFAFNSVQELVQKILEIVVKIGWILAFFFIIYSGFLFVTAAGSENKIKSAKATFMWTVVGSAIVLGAQAISVLLENTATSIFR